MATMVNAVQLVNHQLAMAVKLHQALAAGLTAAAPGSVAAQPSSVKELDAKAANVATTIEQTINDYVVGKTAPLCAALDKWNQAGHVTQHLKDFRAEYARFKAWAADPKNTSAPIPDAVVRAIEDNVSNLASQYQSTDYSMVMPAGDGGYKRNNYKTGFQQTKKDYRGWVDDTGVKTKLATYMDALSKAASDLAAKAKRVQLSNDLKAALASAKGALQAANAGDGTQGPTGDSLKDVLESVDFFDRLEKVRADVREAVAASAADPFDSSKASAADFVQYLETSPRVKDTFAPTLTPEALAVVRALEPSLVAGPVLGALLPSVADAMKQVGERIAALGSAADAADRKRRLDALYKALGALQASLQTAVPDRKALSAAQGVVAFTGAFKAAGDALQGLKQVEAKGAAPSYGAATSAYGAGSAAAAPPGAAASAMAQFAGGLLVRFPDPRRMQQYVRSLAALKDASEKSAAPGRATGLAAQVQEKVAKLTAGQQLDPDDPASRSAVSGSIGAAYGFIAGVKRHVAAYVALHAAFAVRANRDALEYMAYWRGMRAEGARLLAQGRGADDAKAFEDALNKWDETLKALLDDVVRDRMGKFDEARNTSAAVVDKALGGAQEGAPRKLAAEFEALGLYVARANARIRGFFGAADGMAGGGGLGAVLDVPFALLYALKALRLLCAWVALRVASRLFEQMYRRAVYAELRDPPSPAVFVGLFLAADAALGAVVLSFLLLAKHLFSDGGSDFPIDGPFVARWAVDFVAVSALAGALGLILGAVVQNKKFFRYRYEGDRGIRSMQSVMLYVYAVLLLVPFFRLL